MRSPCAHMSCASATISRNALPCPSLAFQTSCPAPVATSATMIDHGDSVRIAPNDGRREVVGVRMNATCAPSGDQTGEESQSTEGERYFSVFVEAS